MSQLLNREEADALHQFVERMDAYLEGDSTFTPQQIIDSYAKFRRAMARATVERLAEAIRENPTLKNSSEKNDAE